MLLPPHSLRLLIVSEDWFIRAYWERLAAETGAFARIATADDGYTGLAEIWESVARQAALNAVVIDRHSVGPSAARLIHELRADTRTAKTFIGIVAPDKTEARAGVNLLCIGEPGQPEMTVMMEQLIHQATVGPLVAGHAPGRRPGRGGYLS